jgi:hypothetical protein
MNLLENQDNQPAGGQSASVEQQPTSVSSVPPPPPETSDGIGGGLRVSLMPEKEKDPGSGLRRWLLILFAALLLETVAFGGGYLYLANLEANRLEEKNSVEQNLNEVVADIRAAEDEAEEAATFDSRAVVADELLTEHLFWTRFFKYLGTQTKKNVSYLNFAGDYDSRTVSMDAVARTYRDVAEQIVVLRENPVIEEVITASATAQVNEKGALDGVAFSLVMTLQPEVWLQQATDNSTEE